MKVLVADDSLVARTLVELLLPEWGYEVVATDNGEDAWRIIQEPDSPKLMILDWMMPGIKGVEICRLTKSLNLREPKYIILLTAMTEKEHIIEGLEAGADDYITKPFHQGEFRARLDVGRRIVELQEALSERAHELQDALDHVKTLQGIFPICMHCHKVRDDADVWTKLENYIAEHTDVKFSHGLCDECSAKYYPEEKPKD